HKIGQVIFLPLHSFLLKKNTAHTTSLKAWAVFPFLFCCLFYKGKTPQHWTCLLGADAAHYK
ncbi:MAG: hypothetical protein UDM12_03885, partial [Prevotellamassilia sp.]|nr:hypothetical protein [Prevotellamassilia sp.]